MRVRKDQVVVRPVGKGIEAGAGTGIIIPITEDLVHDHHKDWESREEFKLTFTLGNCLFNL